MRVICISQARMGSSRLPGKTLKPILGKPLLGYHLDRVKLSKVVDLHIVATTDRKIDQPIVDFCKTQQQAYFCGDEDDVLARFYHAAKSVNANDEDIIIRLTGDCPLICPSLIDEVVTHHLQENRPQYSHISLGYFPRGFDVEVFSMASLTEAYNCATTAPQREHVTLYLYSKPDASITSVETGKTSWAQFRLCVDELDDFVLVENVITHLGQSWQIATPEDICSFLINNPKVAQINAAVMQRTTH